MREKMLTILALLSFTLFSVVIVGSCFMDVEASETCELLVHNTSDQFVTIWMEGGGISRSVDLAPNKSGKMTVPKTHVVFKVFDKDWELIMEKEADMSRMECIVHEGTDKYILYLEYNGEDRNGN